MDVQTLPRSQHAVIAGLLTALAVSGAGQQSPQTNSGEIKTTETPLSFTSRVNLVSVPVVVRDSKGRAVGGLQKDDFQLFDGGKPQIVSGFSTEHTGVAEATEASAQTTVPPGSAAAGPATRVPSRYVALVFDDLHTEFADLAWAREAAVKFLASVPPSARVALYTTSGQVGIDFTSDRDQLLKQLRDVRSFVRRPEACLQISYFIAHLIRKENCVAGELDSHACPTKAAMATELDTLRAICQEGTVEQAVKGVQVFVEGKQ